MAQRFPITLTQLGYFAECAKTLNMTVASQELHVAQSAVSTAISHLERSLGTTLFIRQHSKGLILTPAGEGLLRDTQLLFGFLGDMIENIRADQQELRGSITVACFNTLSPFLLPKLLSRLHVQHPELNVEILEGDYEENLAALRGGRAELSIGYDLTSPEGIARESVGRARPYVLLSTHHPLAEQDELSLIELAAEPFVLLDLPDSRDYFLGILASAGIVTHPRYRASGYETVRSMVSAGLGFSLLNQRPHTRETYSGNEAVAVEIADDVQELGVVVSSLAQIDRSARAEAVVATVREILSEPHPG
ncbi:LysR family transcriptional regulator [Leucobacter sp. CSA1]|uniref:LysR family transcriptional regulator n=1 Tax=Leucobacter chromiisoli TaxID=2796471 RepID=A0A934UUF7_9MICO|nr:LysR substrate-binding domain-containing protein [Leucobacter chromiisoli]MBK0419434.1 LysR family transcriptional regulator [Leucobacter chromiisoli]